MNRKQQIKKNMGNGGTTAPAAGAKGNTTGIGPGPSYPGFALSPRQKQNIKHGQAQKPAGAAGTPGAQAGGPAPTPMPWDVQASNDEASALSRMNNTEASLDSNWFRAEQNYGLQGPWADYKTNPYSQASVLQRSYDNAQRASKNSFAAGGQLYSGSAINANNANTHDFNLSRDQLERQREEAFAKYQADKVGAEDQYHEAQSEAGWKRVQSGIEEEPDASAAPEGPGKKPKAKAKNQKAKPKQQQQNKPQQNTNKKKGKGK